MQNEINEHKTKKKTEHNDVGALVHFFSINKTKNDTVANKVKHGNG